MPIYNAINPLDSLQVTRNLPDANGDLILERTNGYNFSYLTYPLEFDDVSSFGHYMNFYINVQYFSNYVDGRSFSVNNKFLDFASDATWDTEFAPAFGSTFPEYTITENKTPGGVGTIRGNNITIGEEFSVNKLTQNRITQAISLYIPDSMSFTTQIDWQDASATEMGAEALKGAQLGGAGIKSIVDKLRGNPSESLRTIGAAFGASALAGFDSFDPNANQALGNFVAGMGGLAVNPQLFVLFRGIDFRRFQFDFIFTPKSPEEAKNVRNIIKAFRFHSSPEVTAGRYFVAPSTFNIEFMYRGNRNKNIFQMSTCILERISVDYAPYGWSTYKDGMPVQTILSMTFKETEIITKEKVNMGY